VTPIAAGHVTELRAAVVALERLLAALPGGGARVAPGRGADGRDPAARTAPVWAVRYYHLDALGSVRVETDQAAQVVSRHDYRPFGEELAPSSSTDPRRFSGHERDADTGLDYFGARYYRADLGRFTTVDPGHVNGSVDDPQSWNAYAYARNNPLRYTDPDGRTYQVCAKGVDCSFVSDASWEGAMGKAGGGYLFRDGYMWALVDGKWSYAGTYEQISVDSPQINFDSMVHTTGVLADRWLRENATQMAIGSGLSAIGGVVAGVVRGGLAGGAATLGAGATPVVFKTMHYASRLAAAGVNVAKAEAAVGAAIAMGQRAGELVVDGVPLIWRSYAYNGQVYVGTIHVKW